VVCPLCGCKHLATFYVFPPKFRCEGCNATLRDANCTGIPVLSGDVAKRKRPAMYGLPVCACCSHEPHEPGQCEFCDETPLPVNLVPVDEP
jgi:hypothetical protein